MKLIRTIQVRNIPYPPTPSSWFETGGTKAHRHQLGRADPHHACIIVEHVTQYLLAYMSKKV